MVYKLVSSQQIIGRVFERYVIDYSDFISRVPNWVFSALRELNIYTGYIPKQIPATVAEYKCVIPSEVKILDGVEYMGRRLPRMHKMNEYVPDSMPTRLHDTEKYDIAAGTDANAIGDGYIITTFEDGDIIFHTRCMPLVKDKLSNLWFPLIPDVEEVKNALDMFIIMRLLYRGHKVGEFSLKENNPYLNPALWWDTIGKKSARNAATRMDLDEREALSKDIRTFIQDYNNYTDVHFNPESNAPNTGTYS